MSAWWAIRVKDAQTDPALNDDACVKGLRAAVISRVPVGSRNWWGRRAELSL